MIIDLWFDRLKAIPSIGCRNKFKDLAYPHIVTKAGRQNPSSGFCSPCATLEYQALHLVLDCRPVFDCQNLHRHARRLGIRYEYRIERIPFGNS